MRILANYGHKNNGDTYSVTFETMGDVPRDIADSVVDDLFVMAKAAIHRQVHPGEDPMEFPPKEDKQDVIIPRPASIASAGVNGNGTASFATNGKKANGDKPSLKDPDAPASPKQKSLIIRLAKERGRFIRGVNDFTMKEASETIDDLMAVAA